MKKDKKKKPELKKTAITPSFQPEGISKRGKKIIGIGIGIVILGFMVLTATNPSGDNWASILAPFLLVGGYISIAIGIIS